MTERQRREKENQLALGRLRNARKSGMVSKQLREVGWKVRQIIDEKVVAEFEKDEGYQMRGARDCRVMWEGPLQLRRNELLKALRHHCGRPCCRKLVVWIVWWSRDG